MPWQRVDSKDVEQWIREELTQPNPATGKAICPFAKKTLETEAIQIVPAKTDLVAQIDHCCSVFDLLNLDIVVVYIQFEITEKKLSGIAAKAHKRNPKYAVLYDHPDNTGLHQGVSFSYQKCPLVMIQSLPKLKDAQSILRRTGYYDAWGLDDPDMFY